MKTLTLLRHAKSSWDDAVARDFDRPLNGKGKRAAELMGRHLRSLHAHNQARFDRVVASPAVRVVETLEGVECGLGQTLAIEWDKRMYLASVATLLDLVHALPDAADSVMMSGHNPGLEDIVLLLATDRGGDMLRDAVQDKFPTAALAVITFEATRWSDVAAGTGTLAHFTRPRDLDASLGPDIA
jgi:phosphohistidine phosphatase